MTRHEQREVLFKLLFRTEFNDVSEMPSQVQMFFDVDADKEIAEEEKAYLINRENAILDKLPEIDKLISEKATGWTIDRFGKVDLAIVRLAVYEIMFDDDIPVSVAINEAVEIAKKYGRDESSGFVNGVLAKFAK